MTSSTVEALKNGDELWLKVEVFEIDGAGDAWIRRPGAGWEGMRILPNDVTRRPHQIEAQGSEPGRNEVERVAWAMRANRFKRTGRDSTVVHMDAPSENEMDDARAAIAAIARPDPSLGSLRHMFEAGVTYALGLHSRSTDKRSRQLREAAFRQALASISTPLGED